MGRRGTKPKPTARRVLEGNASHRPLNTDEPKPPAPSEDFDLAPLELADRPGAIAEWTRLVPMLRKAGQITVAERSALIALCLQWDVYLDAMGHVKKHGLVVTTKSGYPMTNPYLIIATKALTQCNRLWPELGLTPSSRARISTTPINPGDDPFSEFEFGARPS